MDAGRLGQIAGGPVLGGHGEHIAPGADHCARTVRRDLMGGGLLADIAEAAPTDGQVLVDLHRNAGDLLGLELQMVQESAVLEDEARVAQRREFHGEFLELGEPPGFAVLQIHHVQVGLMGLLAFRDEVDPVAMPHRENVLSRIGRQPGGLTGREVMQPDLIGLATAIALPRAELAEDAVVGHLLAVR